MKIEKKFIDINYTKGVVIKPKYIVIHETANRSKGADANAHYRYWSRNASAKSSAHFVVDDSTVIQLGEFEPGKCRKMWHVGGRAGKYKNPIYNSNSIGIEICVNSDGDYDCAFAKAAELTRYIMSVTGIPAENVVRHYDSWGKHCPATMLERPSLWVEFKRRVSQVDEVIATGKVR